MKKLNFLVFSLIIVFLAVGVFASFNHKNHQIKQVYSEGEKITGWANISFEDEPAESKFTSNFQGNISLIDLLDKNELVGNVDYNCSTPNCKDNYQASNEITQLTLNEDKIIGLKVTGGDITSIESLKFRVQSDFSATCISPLFIDVLNNDEDILISDKYTDDDSCVSPNYACFDQQIGHQEVTLSANLYCNRVTLPRAAAHKLGANIKNSTNGKSSQIKMNLLSVDGVFLGECILPKHTQGVENLECIINYATPEQKDYLACVKLGTTSGGTPDYKINSETNNPICGSDNEGLSFTRDYEIYTKMMRFDGVDMLVDDGLFSRLYNLNLVSYVSDYVYNNYQGICQPYCIVPVKIYGTSGQTLTFSEVVFSYKDGNTLVNDNNLYGTSVSPVTINSKPLKLDIGKANFLIPYGTTQNKFRLSLDGRKVFEDTIKVSKSFEFDVSPKFVAFGRNVLFKATVPGNKTIIKSEWDFGDGEEEISSGSSVSHTYIEEGSFDLKVTLTSSDNLTGTRSFQINVGDAKESAEKTIADYKIRISDIKKDILGYPDWIKVLIEQKIDVDELKFGLNSSEYDYNHAETDEDYVQVMLDLLDLSIPYSINVSKNGKLPLAIGFENIDVSYIESISGSEVSDQSELEQAIGGWMADNYDGNINFEDISAFYDRGPEVILSKFKTDVIPVGDSVDSNFIIGYSSEGIKFKSDYGEIPVEGGTYIPLDGSRKNFEFSIVDGIATEDLGIYISPAINVLGIADQQIREPKSNKFNWIIFILGIVVLFVVTFVVYIILQEWYKRNYESHLFKSENELYNLVNFVNNARKNGMNDSQIRFKLKQNKWTGEQVAYATRKLDGKRTGMFEIPIFRSREKEKVREEIMKRQHNPEMRGFS